MSTKNNICSFQSQKKQQHLQCADSNGSFKNLNLNENYKCSSHQTVKSICLEKVEDNKLKDLPNKSDHNSRGGSSLWNKTDSRISDNVINKSNKGKKEKEKCEGSSKSTVSLHVAAYENSKKQLAASDKTDAPLTKKCCCCYGCWRCKKGKHCFTKKICENCFKNVSKIQTYFEIPRQQEQPKPLPEIMQFKASQKLKNVNSSNNVETTVDGSNTPGPPNDSMMLAGGNAMRHNVSAPPGFSSKDGFGYQNHYPPSYQQQQNFGHPPDVAGVYPYHQMPVNPFLPQQQPPTFQHGWQQQQALQQHPRPSGNFHQNMRPAPIVFPRNIQFHQNYIPLPPPPQHYCPPHMMQQQQQQYMHPQHPQQHQYMIPPHPQQQQCHTVPVMPQQQQSYVIPPIPQRPRQHPPLSPQMEAENAKVENASINNEICDQFHNQVLKQIHDHNISVADPSVSSQQQQPHQQLPQKDEKAGDETTKGCPIDWNHPEVAAVMDDIVNQSASALSHKKAAEKISQILNRCITKPTVQSRIGTMKKKLRQREGDKKKEKDGKRAMENILHQLGEIAKNYDLFPRRRFLPQTSPTTSPLQMPSSPAVPMHMAANPMTKYEMDKIHFQHSFDPHSPFDCHQDFDEMEPKVQFKGRLSNSNVVIEKSDAKQNATVSPGSQATCADQPQCTDNTEKNVEQLLLREGLNTRLNPCLLMDVHDVTYQYTYQNQKEGKIYYCCSTCRSQPAPRSNIVIFVDGSISIGEHSPGCVPLSKSASLFQQQDRWGRLESLKGTAPFDAFMKVFSKAKVAKVDSEMACNYAFYRKQYGRWHQQRFDHCTMKSIAERYRTLYGDDTRWLDYNDEKLAVFATDESYRQLALCKILVGDATFATSPEGIRQVFVIHGLVENDQGAEWVPLLLAIMAEKTEANYQQVMDTIRTAWTRLGVEPVTERVHCDYEAAEGNALKNLFGADKIFGCYFHYNQIIIKKLDAFKFKYAYLMTKGDKVIPEYRSIRTWIRCLMALPLLPKKEGMFLWETILNELPKPPETDEDIYWPTEEMEKFKAYFVKNWINRKDEMWNFFGMGRVKNTNRAEAHHSSQRRKYKTHPALNEYIHNAQLDYTLYDTRIRQLSGNCKTAPRNKKYQKLEETLKNYETRLLELLDDPEISEADRISILYGYCRRVSYLMYDVRKPLKKKKTEKGKQATVLKEEANDTFIWKKDLNFSHLSSDHHFTLAKTEESMINHGFLFDDDEFIEAEKEEDIQHLSILINDDDMDDGCGDVPDYFSSVVLPGNIEHNATTVEALHPCTNNGTSSNDQLTQKNDTIDLSDGIEIIYDAGEDHPAKLHLDRLIKDRFLDDVIIMKYLQQLIAAEYSCLIVDCMIWHEGFRATNWGPVRVPGRLPTVPHYSELWETAFVPININENHWTLAIIIKSQKIIIYFDPLKKDIPSTHLPTLLKIGQLLVGDLCTYYRVDPGTYMSQGDGFNCGVIICLLARSYLYGLNPFYTKEQLKEWRRRMHDWLQQGENGMLELGF